MTENEKLSAQMIRQIIGPLLQSLDKNELLELLAQASLVSQVGAEKLQADIAQRISDDGESVNVVDIVFLALYALAQAKEEEVTPQ